MDDVRPYLNQALAFIVPLRAGGGTRLKILQALAMGCPIISTKLGAEGLLVKHEKHLLFADTVEQFECALKRLQTDPELRLSLSQAGRQLVEQHYSWRQCLRGFDTLYQAIL